MTRTAVAAPAFDPERHAILTAIATLFRKVLALR